MRRLILMRHAKSSWAEAGQDDALRPLNPRGRWAAAALGRWLKAAGYRPEHALVSTAVRAQETWADVAAAFGAVPMTPLAGLYHAQPEVMLEALRHAPDAAVVLMLGHQPGIGAFGRKLLADLPEDPGFARFPTGATAVIDFDTDAWSHTGWGSGRCAVFVVPRSLD